MLGKAAGEAAVALAGGTDIAALPGVAKFNKGKKGVEMNSILLTPDPITKDTLDHVIDAGWISKEEACAGVKAGTREGLRLILLASVTQLNHHGRVIRGWRGLFVSAAVTKKRPRQAVGEEGNRCRRRASPGLKVPR